MSSPEFHVNVDHVATLRQARRTVEPSPLEAVKILEGTGTSGITTHLREDRRHINDQDIQEIDAYLRDSRLSLTFEMGATEEIRDICLTTQAKLATIVPEKREELTTEGGLDLLSHGDHLKEFIKPIQANGTKISFFVDPVLEQIQASKSIGAEFVEIHTGTYANLFIQYHGDRANYLLARDQVPLRFEDLVKPVQEEVLRIGAALNQAQELKLKVNLGHGLTIPNLPPLLERLEGVQELHIGHSLVANSVYYGLTEMTQSFLHATAHFSEHSIGS